MVCSKCQKLVKQTSLVTPDVKKKSEIYYGSPASGSGIKGSGGASSANVTLGKAGISKVSRCTITGEFKSSLLTIE